MMPSKSVCLDCKFGLCAEVNMVLLLLFTQPCTSKFLMGGMRGLRFGVTNAPGPISSSLELVGEAARRRPSSLIGCVIIASAIFL